MLIVLSMYENYGLGEKCLWSNPDFITDKITKHINERQKLSCIYLW